MRRSVMLAAAVALTATSLGVGASAYARSSGPMTVDITGTNILHINRFIETTYRFPDKITVRQGAMVRFVNKSDDVHTVSLVRAADLPTTVAGVFTCNLCNAVNTVFGANGPGLPKGVQIDNGKLNDDESDHDADLPDPSVPAGAHLPFPVLLQDFNVPSYTTSGGAVIGDSVIVPDLAVHAGFVARVIQVTVSPGTYHYFCTFHAWMQGTLVVTS